MSKNKKILLGILTFSPIIGMIFYFICFIAMFITMGGMIPSEAEIGQGGPPKEMGTFMGLMGTAMIILLLTMLVSVGMMIYYIIHVLNNKSLSQEKNEPIIWILLVLMAGFIGQFVYWYMKIWKENPNDLSLNSGGNTTND